MTSSRRSLALAAVLVGVLAGAIAAAGHHSTQTAPARHVTIGPPAATQDRLPDGRFDPGRAHLIVDRRTLRIDARLPDPAGGPAWAVRVYDAQRVSLRRPSRTLDHPVWRQRVRCFQLGRMLGGRFGWIYPGERFRQVSPQTQNQLAMCPGTKHPSILITSAATLIARTGREPRIERSVAWGLAPPGSDQPTVRGIPDAHIAPVGRAGALLALGRRRTVPGRVFVSVRGPDGSKQQWRPKTFRLPGAQPLVPGSVRAEARTPDPAGGPSWALAVARVANGGPCLLGAGRLVDGHIGFIDGVEGLFADIARRSAACDPSGSSPTRARPLDVSYGFGYNPEDERGNPLNRRARVERRLQPGRTTIIVRCTPDVRLVRIATPRDIRTLRPSAVGHVVFAIYDGHFPSGQLTVTGVLKDGRKVTQRFPVGSS